MSELSNLIEWAKTQGYDPDVRYGVPQVEGQLSPHFNAKEFVCRHCKEAAPYPNTPPAELLDILEDVRSHFGKPVYITSGYRCPVHNKAVGGATHSYHLRGMAADIQIEDVSSEEIYAYLDPNTRIGLGKYKTFVHVDVRGQKARW